MFIIATRRKMCCRIATYVILKYQTCMGATTASLCNKRCTPRYSVSSAQVVGFRPIAGRLITQTNDQLGGADPRQSVIRTVQRRRAGRLHRRQRQPTPFDLPLKAIRLISTARMANAPTGLNTRQQAPRARLHAQNRMLSLQNSFPPPVL
jgi:hypothetical protein